MLTTARDDGELMPSSFSRRGILDELQRFEVMSAQRIVSPMGFDVSSRSRICSHDRGPFCVCGV